MKTPIHQLIDQLGEIYSANPTYPEYRAGLAEALSTARKFLDLEKSHIKQAWQEGAQGIINQSSDQYFKKTYLSESKR